jgi:hypothetical protein
MHRNPIVVVGAELRGRLETAKDEGEGIAVGDGVAEDFLRRWGVQVPRIVEDFALEVERDVLEIDTREFPQTMPIENADAEIGGLLKHKGGGIEPAGDLKNNVPDEVGIIDAVVGGAEAPGIGGTNRSNHPQKGLGESVVQ